VGAAGRGFSSAGRRAHVSSRRAEARRSKRAPGDPRGRYPPRRRAGLTVSSTSERPFGQTTGPRLKRASGSLQWNSAFEAEPERWSGIRTRDRMLIRHLLYPSELSSWLIDRNRTGASGKSQCSASELRPQPSFSGTRDTQSAPRQPGLREPEHEAERRAGLMTRFRAARKTKLCAYVAFIDLDVALCRGGHSATRCGGTSTPTRTPRLAGALEGQSASSPRRRRALCCGATAGLRGRTPPCETKQCPRVSCRNSDKWETGSSGRPDTSGPPRICSLRSSCFRTS